MGKTKKIICLLGMLAMLGCATVPKVDRCATENNIRFVTLVGSEVEHKSCYDMDIVTWKNVVEVCRNGVWRGSNLWATWNGCRYMLVQQNGPEDITIVGYFKNFEQMKEFIEITMPMVEKKKHDDIWKEFEKTLKGLE